MTYDNFFEIGGGRAVSSRFFDLCKHLKSQLGPCVGEVTFFNQRRSVGARVGDVTFLDHNWDPLRVESVCL